jgi:WhiB family transcriptional regulator, redox-sensing transcriptional regulator
MSGDWQEQAVCGGLGHLFFGPEDESADARQVREARARAICAGCPVRVRCLEYRLADDYQGDGAIWGGEDEYERKRIRRNRLRALTRRSA